MGPPAGYLAPGDGEGSEKGQNKNLFYTTLTKFSTKYLMMCKVYTDVGGIK